MSSISSSQNQASKQLELWAEERTKALEEKGLKAVVEQRPGTRVKAKVKKPVK